MVKIQDERDIQDALEEMNKYLEARGSALYVTIVPRVCADALNEFFYNGTWEGIKITKGKK